VAKKPLLLMILDGWGIAPPSPYNAVTQAKTPNLQGCFQNYPHTQLLCSGENVGLPAGQMGNSEVGHLEHRCRTDYLSGLDQNYQGD
jgi:2,3-bisphosphoglycerate-independent phosphoglycerate mutase